MSDAASPGRQDWNHRPEVPIATSPLWQWPPDFPATVKWYRDAWFWITVNLMVLGLAIISWVWFSPTLAQAATLSPGWIGMIFLRNFVLIGAVAGGLHLYFHTLRRQGRDKRFDPRELAARGRAFTLGSQVRDNMFWTLTSGVAVWSGFEVLFWWAFGVGYLPVLSFGANPLWFIAIFFLIPIWESLYFYWIHRALHTRWLYRVAHSLHHRNTNIGPWSGLSMHPIEHVMFLGGVLVHLFVLSHPLHIVFHLQFYALLAVTTHSGFEGLFAGGKKRLHLGNFHHQMHHRYFEVNYGNLDVPWDKLFGSFHDGTPQAHEAMKVRRRRMQTR